MNSKKCLVVTGLVNHGKKVLCACVACAGSKLGRGASFGESGHAVREAYNELACLAVRDASRSAVSGAWEGKHRVDLKEFWRGPLPAKNRLHLSFHLSSPTQHFSPSLHLIPSSSPHKLPPFNSELDSAMQQLPSSSALSTTKSKTCWHGHNWFRLANVESAQCQGTRVIIHLSTHTCIHKSFFICMGHCNRLARLHSFASDRKPFFIQSRCFYVFMWSNESRQTGCPVSEP